MQCATRAVRHRVAPSGTHLGAAPRVTWGDEEADAIAEAIEPREVVRRRVVLRLGTEEREDIEQSPEARQAHLDDLALIWIVPRDLRLEEAQPCHAPRAHWQPADELRHASEQPDQRGSKPLAYQRRLAPCVLSLRGEVGHQAKARRDATLVGVAQPPHGLERHPRADRVTDDHEIGLTARRQLALEEAGDVVDLRRQSSDLRVTCLPRACYVQT